MDEKSAVRSEPGELRIVDYSKWNFGLWSGTMGFFRRYKANRFSLEEVRAHTASALKGIRQADLSGLSDEAMEELLIRWACWRELQARKEADNEGREV